MENGDEITRGTNEVRNKMLEAMILQKSEARKTILDWLI